MLNEGAKVASSVCIQAERPRANERATGLQLQVDLAKPGTGYYAVEELPVAGSLACSYSPCLHTLPSLCAPIYASTGHPCWPCCIAALLYRIYLPTTTHPPYAVCSV